MLGWDETGAPGEISQKLPTTCRIKESNPEPSRNEVTEWQHHTFLSIRLHRLGGMSRGWNGRDFNQTSATAWRRISQAGNRHGTKWATQRIQHVSLQRCSGREHFPFPSPRSTSQIRCVRFGERRPCLVPSGSEGHRRSRPRMKTRNNRQAHLSQLMFPLMKTRPAWVICLFASLIVS